MNLTELEPVLKKRKEFTVPDVQHELTLGYGEVRRLFKDLEAAGKIRFCGGLTFAWEEKTRTEQPAQSKKDEKSREDRRNISDWHRYFKDYHRILLDDDNDEDDDDYLDDDDIDSLFDFPIVSEEDKVPESNEAEELTNCKMLDSYFYGEMLAQSDELMRSMLQRDFRYELKSIQIGTSVTRYVYKITSKITEVNFSMLEYCIKRNALNRESISFESMYCGKIELFAVEVKRDQELDGYCKKALLYWLSNCNGRASISSIQRGLRIPFNRSGHILDELQNLFCVECRLANDPQSKPINVMLSKEDVEVLFPKSLGWTD